MLPALQKYFSFASRKYNRNAGNEASPVMRKQLREMRMEGSPSQRWLAVNHSALEGRMRSLESNSKLQSRSLLPKISSLDKHTSKEGVLTPMGTRKSVYNKLN